MRRYTVVLNALDSSSTVAMGLQAVDVCLQAIARPVEDLADQVNRLIARSELELTSGVHANQEDLHREIRDTSLLDTPDRPPIAVTRSSTLRVETPCT